MGQYLREFAWTSQAGKYVSAASIVKNCCSIRPHLMGSVHKWSSCHMKCALNETCNDLFFLDTWGKWKEDTNTAVLQIPSDLIYLNKRPELKKKGHVSLALYYYIIIICARRHLAATQVSVDGFGGKGIICCSIFVTDQTDRST